MVMVFLHEIMDTAGVFQKGHEHISAREKMLRSPQTKTSPAETPLLYVPFVVSSSLLWEKLRDCVFWNAKISSRIEYHSKKRIRGVVFFIAMS